MSQRQNLAVLGLSAVLFACTATGEAQRPIVTAAIGKVVEGLATEIGQRQATETFHGLPVVVRGGMNSAEAVIAEMLRTRLTERSIPVEVACPAKCFEITLTEFVMEATGQATAGQILPVSAGAIAGLEGPPLMPREALAAGHASALLVTLAVREGNRYSGRQQQVAIVAVARTAAKAR
ncbi:MAG TPA: hypothetical protein VLW55_23270 [Burkholderiaceae bacterium]|nr:hypothetical protein [Burkholderiaceae bacterium]